MDHHSEMEKKISAPGLKHDINLLLTFTEIKKKNDYIFISQ